MCQIILICALFLHSFHRRRKKHVYLFDAGLILFFLFIKTLFIQNFYGQCVFCTAPNNLDVNINLLSEQKEQTFNGKNILFTLFTKQKFHYQLV